MHLFKAQSSVQIETRLDEMAPLVFSVGIAEKDPQMIFDLGVAWNGHDAATLSSRLSPFFVGDPLKEKNWDLLFGSLLARWPSWGAWHFNQVYQWWQGASEVNEFYSESYGPLPPGYRTHLEPSGSPWLAPKRLIDLSMNPGRPHLLAPGVSFYPTAEMWLGPHFWQYAKCAKEEALAADFFLEKRDTPHFLYLKSWPTAFTRPDGEQGRMQQRLWKLFFHEDCEWPPGSGTICDEPMFGPPELMPGYIPHAS
jgi:hypothetical protein